jgi:hypothetical protein
MFIPKDARVEYNDKDNQHLCEAVEPDTESTVACRSNIFGCAFTFDSRCLSSNDDSLIHKCAAILLDRAAVHVCPSVGPSDQNNNDRMLIQIRGSNFYILI